MLPVDFMSSLQLDKLSNEIQAARPSDVPGAPVPLWRPPTDAPTT